VAAWHAFGDLPASSDDPVSLAVRAVTEDRLVRRPVFILSSVRSGSTLLRVMLNTHSEILAPHELHLSGIKVDLANPYTKRAMREVGLGPNSLQFMLWDRLLHHELMRHHKRVLVNKTPSDAFMCRRILRCWPDARFIYLLRHPAAVTDSWQRARRGWTRDEAGEQVKRYMVAVERARARRGGLTVKYEDITVEPEREMRRICEFIGVTYEPAMVDYGQGEHGAFQAGLGDWGENIRSGKIQRVEQLPAPDEIPASLVGISKKWGYVS
jgi:hypothetical protein